MNPSANCIFCNSKLNKDSAPTQTYHSLCVNNDCVYLYGAGDDYGHFVYNSIVFIIHFKGLKIFSALSDPIIEFTLSNLNELKPKLNYILTFS